MKIKDLKVGDIIKIDSYFHKVLDKTDNLVAISKSWREDWTHKEGSSLSYACHFSEHDLKDYTLVTPEWKASELKDGDKYWYISCQVCYGLETDYTTWDNNDEVDRFHLKSGNIYKTEEDAEKACQEIMNKE